MFRRRPVRERTADSFPHASGDVPPAVSLANTSQALSPREWGCSVSNITSRRSRLAFPTRVGMFREGELATATAMCFPHASGDVPEKKNDNQRSKGLSPREWGCSADSRIRARFGNAFPTRVGMFRVSGLGRSAARCFPHASGDVPPLWFALRLAQVLSPREWGCSATATYLGAAWGAFPTRVGMFRRG